MNKELIKQLTPEDYKYLSHAMYDGVVHLRNVVSNIEEITVNQRWSIVKDFIDDNLDSDELTEELYNDIYGQLSEEEKDELSVLIKTNPIRGIKYIAEHTNCGLKEAKCVNDYIRNNGRLL